jgi:molybdopterin-guanine dinucleotide biosynthesis protein A
LSARPGSGAAAWGAARGWPVLHDAAGHADGPLAGVHAGLVWAMKMGADALATAPCDTPFLPADLIARLASALSDAPGAVAAASPGRIEPLCALWTTSLLSDLTAALAQGRHPAIHTLVTELGFAVVNFGAPAAFANINTTADLR